MMMIRPRHFHKGLRLVRSVVTGRPMDPDVRQSLELLRIRARRWHGVVTRQPFAMRLQHEFNLWAEKGVGEDMYHPHLRITRQCLERMNVAPGERVLDLGCGAGLGSRLLAGAVSAQGQVLAMDISDRMLVHARAQAAKLNNVNFACASAEQLPFPDGFFSKVLSVEAFYYFEHQERVLAELQRVLAPSGRLFVLICLYKDHPESLATVEAVNVPVHVRSMAEYVEMLRAQGWQDVQVEEFIRKRKVDEKKDVHDRALLLSAQKAASA